MFLKIYCTTELEFRYSIYSPISPWPLVLGWQLQNFHLFGIYKLHFHLTRNNRSKQLVMKKMKLVIENHKFHDSIFIWTRNFQHFTFLSSPRGEKNNIQDLNPRTQKLPTSYKPPFVVHWRVKLLVPPPPNLPSVTSISTHSFPN